MTTWPVQPNLVSCFRFASSQRDLSILSQVQRRRKSVCCGVWSLSTSKSLNWASGLWNMHLFWKALKSLVEEKTHFITRSGAKKNLPTKKILWKSRLVEQLKRQFKLQNSENLTDWTLPNSFHRCLIGGKLEFFLRSNKSTLFFQKWGLMTIGMKMMIWYDLICVNFLKDHFQKIPGFQKTTQSAISTC